jgi:hypothetical protein
MRQRHVPICPAESGQPASTVLLGEKQRPRLAHDLFRGVAEDALRPFVPAHDVAGRVHPKDSILLNCLDHQPEPFLGQLQCILGPLALGHVPQDLGVAGQLPLGVAERSDDAQGPEPFAAFAPVPAFVLGAAPLPSLPQFPLGRPASTSSGVKMREKCWPTASASG